MSTVLDNSDIEKRFEAVLKALNTLESIPAYEHRLRDNVAERNRRALSDARATCARAGITLSDIDELAVIHVTGTKGKGSTCAYTESILRAHGYKTGFFSSPHLVDIRERIKINGLPIDKNSFCDYFWEVFTPLEETKDQCGGYMPHCFLFLVVLAFHAFRREKVDVSIIEVGIGGEYDTTNIVRNPVVCGISSLDIDHVNWLGNTLESIAWHKAGILKTGAPAVTVPQPCGSIRVLHDRAYEKGCPLFETAPSIFDYDPDLELGIPGNKQDVNAILALHLCHIWLKNHDRDEESRLKLYKEYIMKSIPKAAYLQRAPFIHIPDFTRRGLATCRWPGRCQVIQGADVTYYVDGAHTPASIEVCCEWFQKAAANETINHSGNVVKVLMFNVSGDRDAKTLMKSLIKCDFDAVAFCPSIVNFGLETPDCADMTKELLENCRENKKIWLELTVGASAENADSMQNGVHINDAVHSVKRNAPCVESFATLQEGLRWATHDREPRLPDMSMMVNSPRIIRDAEHIQILCTGSLYLVGTLIRFIDPDFTRN